MKFHPLVLISVIFPTLALADRVGFILPLTGPLATYGTAVQNGLALSVEDGAPNQFRFEDSQADPKPALNAFNKLVNIDKVEIVYIWGASDSRAIAPLVDNAKALTFYNSSDPDVNAVSPKFGIRFRNDGLAYSTKTAQYLRDQRFKNIALVKAEVPYFSALETSLRKEISSEQKLKDPILFSAIDTDFGSTIARLKREQPDAIAVFLFPAQIAPFYRQLRNLNFVIPTIGTDVYADSELIKQAKGTMSGAVFADDLIKDEFVSKYLKRFGTTTQLSHAANAYEFGQLLTRSMAKGPLSAHSLRDLFDEIGHVSGRAVEYTAKRVNGLRLIETPVVMKKIE